MQAGLLVRTGGLVVVRQKPPTAKGMVFLMLEDETGRLQAAVTPPVFERLGPVLRHGALWLQGRLESGGAGRTPEGSSSFRSLLVHEAGPLEELLGEPVFDQG
jgi:DNA polymerase III alpha subunit